MVAPRCGGRTTRAAGGNGSPSYCRAARVTASTPAEDNRRGTAGGSHGSGPGGLQESGTPGRAHPSGATSPRRYSQHVPPLVGRTCEPDRARASLRPGNDLICANTPVPARVEPEHLCAAARWSYPAARLSLSQPGDCPVFAAVHAPAGIAWRTVSHALSERSTGSEDSPMADVEENRAEEQQANARLLQ